ncbi:MAG: response regulator [Verrucomicrobiota bacterium]|nr:response regulator [Verrucomicrobiota bacterium]
MSLQAACESPITKNARILIIDDEPDNIMGLKRLLDRQGYAICISITDPREAIEQFATMQPDLVLLDWHMTPISGLKVLQELGKRIQPSKMPPILVLTADGASETKREALTAGATDFLAKPFDFSEVLLRIGNLLRLRMLNIQSETENHRLEEKVRERTGQLEAAVAELKDVRHQVIRQERLRALGTMASGIAHDFNNVLTVIRGYSDLYLQKDDRCDLKEMRRCLETIRTAAGDATDIVRRLREFYRPFTPGEEDRGPVNMNALVEDAIQLSLPKWKIAAQANGVFINLHKEFGTVPIIAASAPELREVLMNLIFNAVDAMPKGGQLTLRTGMDDGCIFFQVEDTGEGMTEATRLQCLEPFFTTKGEMGTGLGLAISYGIVRRHEGNIEIESEVGRGTKITILLPASKPAEQDPEPMLSEVPHSLSVLVVDDQPEIRDVLSRYLECDSHRVVTAQDGCDGLARFREGAFDVVITDRVMPEMNGDQLATAIKAINPDEPVILLTGFAEQSGRASDADLFLSKPASLRMIRDAIGKAVAGRDPLHARV